MDSDGEGEGEGEGVAVLDQAECIVVLTMVAGAKQVTLYLN